MKSYLVFERIIKEYLIAWYVTKAKLKQKKRGKI